MGGILNKAVKTNSHKMCQPGLINNKIEMFGHLTGIDKTQRRNKTSLPAHSYF